MAYAFNEDKSKFVFDFDDAFSSTSENPVQNKVIKNAFDHVHDDVEVGNFYYGGNTQAALETFLNNVAQQIIGKLTRSSCMTTDENGLGVKRILHPIFKSDNGIIFEFTTVSESGNISTMRFGFTYVDGTYHGTFYESIVHVDKTTGAVSFSKNDTSTSSVYSGNMFRRLKFYK